METGTPAGKEKSGNWFSHEKRRERVKKKKMVKQERGVEVSMLETS